ncbi:hypothetical protein [Cellulomonas cellasea]|uniref:Uncharacterized protein n=2 Tax=Cellulomonas cellasea TaxID=43670 RepID=A0A0A0B7A1_9CELL|nr:hypothetical protein [Cellulomonas cellasea]KGM02098.1 hypothetical protein Q760_15510 [Cellulomonas cellasea DSM 20118]GEA86466.1 hypothetical protein CCE01nite_04150 [Cellulomonas cellasea]
MDTLRDALDRATRIVVARGIEFDPTPVKRRQAPRNEIVGQVDDPAALAQLPAALRLADVQELGGMWIAAPSPILALYADLELLGTVRLVGGPWVSSPWWAWDMQLREPERLARWMDEHVPGSGHACTEP